MIKNKKLLFLCSVIFILFFLFFNRENQADKLTHPQSYISVQFSGGQLGNQMFDIAATLAYAWDHHLKPMFPGLNQQENAMAYNRDHIFFRLDASESPVPLTLYQVMNPGYVDIPKDLKNVALTGGFFSWKYFDHHRQKIVDIFAPSEAIMKKLIDKYGDLIQSDHTVSIHVRTYSKKIHDEGLHFVGMKFFEEAMSKFPFDSQFIVFSDRIQWCKANFTRQFPDKQFVFIEGNDHIEDMYLMSMMKHHIVSRSTFSWWAAYLNPNPNKVVYIPILNETTLRGKLKPYAKAFLAFFGKVFWWDENFWLPEWKVIKYSIEPYPEDIYNYGDQTTSLFAGDK